MLSHFMQIKEGLQGIAYGWMDGVYEDGID